jgi:hypothetical protein
MNSLNALRSITRRTSMVPLFVDVLTPPSADLYVLLKPPPSADLFVLLTSSYSDLYVLLFLLRTVPVALSFSSLWCPTSPPHDNDPDGPPTLYVLLSLKFPPSPPRVAAFLRGVLDFHPTTFQFLSSSVSLSVGCCVSRTRCP